MRKLPAATGKNEMDENVLTMKTIGHYLEYLMRLEKACSGVGISQGRAVQYKRCVKELYENEDKRSRDNLLSYNESYEIVDIYEIWEPYVHRFPGILEKLRKCLGKGPLLQEDENPDSSTNRPRNEAFVYFLAGRLIQAGINVKAVDGILSDGADCHVDADITIEFKSSLIDVQCKRPQAERNLISRAKEAYGQIRNSPRIGQEGIIAIDCSSLIRQEGYVLESDSGESAYDYLSGLLVDTIHQKLNIQLSNKILGILLFARIPAMTRVYESMILTHQGAPFLTQFRPDSVSSFVIAFNEEYPNPELLNSFYALPGILNQGTS